jgi:5-methylcytosine-specific restriction endonuclease McrA
MSDEELIGVVRDKYGKRFTPGDLLRIMVIFGNAQQWRRLFTSAANKEKRREIYLAYMASNVWKHKRKAVIEAAKGACGCCGATAVQAHHLTYKNLGDEPPEDLEAICVSCHREEHGRLP